MKKETGETERKKIVNGAYFNILKVNNVINKNGFFILASTYWYCFAPYSALNEKLYFCMVVEGIDG